MDTYVESRGCPRTVSRVGKHAQPIRSFQTTSVRQETNSRFGPEGIGKCIWSILLTPGNISQGPASPVRCSRNPAHLGSDSPSIGDWKYAVLKIKPLGSKKSSSTFTPVFTFTLVFPRPGCPFFPVISAYILQIRCPDRHTLEDVSPSKPFGVIQLYEVKKIYFNEYSICCRS